MLTIESSPPPRLPKQPNRRVRTSDARAAGTLPPTLDRWSGGFSQWGQSLRPCPKGPTFPRYRGHPKGVFTGPRYSEGLHPSTEVTLPDAGITGRATDPGSKGRRGDGLLRAAELAPVVGYGPVAHVDLLGKIVNIFISTRQLLLRGIAEHPRSQVLRI